MLEKILVCLDGSTPAERILSYVTPEAVARHSKLVLLNIVEMPESMIPLNIPGSPAVPVSTSGAVKRTSFEERTEEDYLEGQAKALTAQGLDVDYVVLSGSAGVTIVNYARENGCTLIAIATHGHGGFRRFALGSTADYVVHHSSIPVLTVRR
ncbi:MAG: universal stress protein [Dehalococcoidales bacterium]